MNNVESRTRTVALPITPPASPPALALALVTLLLTSPAAATVIAVDSPGDDLEDNGNCTLREAVEAANTDTAVDACPAGSAEEADEIVLPIGTFALGLEGAQEDENQTGDLDLTGDVTLRGAGPFITTIDAMALDRAIDVQAGADVTVQDLTITHGQTPPVSVDNPSEFSDIAALFSLSAGGGVRNRGNLVIERCRIVENETGDGTQLSFNGALLGLQGGMGGGVATVGGTLTIVESTIADNQTGDGAPSSAGALAEIGIGGPGGGIGALAPLTLERSTVSGNHTGASHLSEGATSLFPGGGGGLAAFAPLGSLTVTVDRSTITANGTVGGSGGGVVSIGATLLLTETTVTGNSAAVGGGLSGLTAGYVIGTASLVSGNTAETGPDCAPGFGGDYNLVGDATDCSVAGDHTVTGAGANLGELASHGGLTQTIALLDGSTAIDAGPPECAAVDQRGTARPQGDGCDIGAFELSLCGNGSPDDGEACDDAGDSATCNVDCTAVDCGDGYVNAAAGEECDTGEALSDTEPNTCRTSCLLPGCGDDVTDLGEACDDAGDSALCDADCTPVECGDGYPNPTAGEECDTGDARSDTEPDACRTTCVAAACGDGTVDTGEACDDGADNSDTAADACRTTCVEASCGDGTVDTGEACDDGGDNSDTAADACRTTCVEASCGDGAVDTGEECDDGGANSDVTPSACRTTCVEARCGDGTIDGGEGCDDGNTDDGDGCDASCLVESGWACVLELGGSACTFLADCGNGVLDDGEACEDGNTDDNDGCDASCQLEDGFDCTTGADGLIESCDPIAGDGLVVGDEQCDDDNTDAGDGCTDGLIEDGWACNAAEPSVCTPLALCGDGVLNGGEDCDDDNTDDGDGCSAFCDVEDGWTCDTSADPSVCQELTGPEGADFGDLGVDAGGDVQEGDAGSGGGSSSGCCAVAASQSTTPSSTVLWALGLVGLVWLKRRARPTERPDQPPRRRGAPRGAKAADAGDSDPQPPPKRALLGELGAFLAPWRFLLLLAALAASATLAKPAAATEIGVTVFTDDLEDNGNCTLREAVQAANTDAAVDACPAGSDAEADEIVLVAGTYTLSIAGNSENANQTGDLDVLGEVTLRGSGPFATTIDAGGLDRALHVLPEATVLVRDLTVTGGLTPAPVLSSVTEITDPNQLFALSGGGGLLNEGALTVERCRIVGNTTGNGGVFTDPQLPLPVPLPGGGGGGVASIAGSLTIRESTVADNVTGDGGSSDLPISPPGLGIEILGAGGLGGGIGVFGGALTLERSTVSGNQTGVPLSAPSSLAGGGGVAALDVVGGGIDITVDRSTIAGNVANSTTHEGWDTEYAAGGGLFSQANGTQIVRESTIANNEALSGGGIATTTNDLTVRVTLIAGNTAPTGPDCLGFGSDDYNLIGDSTGCTIQNVGANDILDGTALLGDLALNQGLTETLALLEGSDAIDAGPPDCATPDQRGQRRPQLDGCDIGAYEFSLCGNGVVDAAAGEECDTSGESATCDSDCTFVECGDGLTNTTAGEECDTGEALSDTEPDACRTTCVLAYCGDGVDDTPEQCDERGDAETCDADCTPAACGDGYENPVAGEECDTGDARSDTEPDACRLACLDPSCGDDVVDTGEECDDGELNDDTAANACRTACLLPYCGDGVTDTGEVCDDGGDNSDVAADACRTTCVPASCGDGVSDTGEECDDGADNSDFRPSACRTSCVEAVCGDGVIDLGEGCDDGGTADGDGCSATCTVERGWGCVYDVALGSTCTYLPSCGNGVLDEGEDCDDGGTANDDGCSDTCALEDGWDCTTDEAGVIDACDPIDGDGLVVGDEQCDDGNEDAGDGCVDGLIEDGWACNAAEPSVCTPLVNCGDGVLDGGEDCDDGNTDDGDGCSRVCDVEDGWLCDTSTEPSDCELAGPGDGGGDAGPDAGDVGGDVGDAGDMGGGDAGEGGTTLSGGGAGCCAVAATSTPPRSQSPAWLLGLLGLAWLRRRRSARADARSASRSHRGEVG